jgi:hypothetical protein
MPGQRRTARPRTRGSRLPTLAGLGAIVVLASAGAAAYVLAFHPAKPRHVDVLPSKVVNFQSVGLVGEPAQSGGGSPKLVQLLGSQNGPTFSPVQQSAQVNGLPEWTADLMQGGTYIFIYLPTGQCLTSTGPASRTVLQVQRCDLRLQQRWRRLGNPVVQGGHDFYQFANAASGKCLAQVSVSASQPGGAGLAACDPARPVSQLLAFWWTAS